MKIEIKAKFPIDWDKEYYFIGCSEKRVFAPCDICDSTGKITIKGKEFTCPECKGNWREKKVIDTINKYSVEKYKLDSITVANPVMKKHIILSFKKQGDNGHNSIKVSSENFDTMLTGEYFYISSKKKYLYDDYAETLAEVKRRNKEEKQRLQAKDEVMV